MTMPRFAHKRVGYLAANQCFTEDTEVVLLCTNHLQKEFKSQNPVRDCKGDRSVALGARAPPVTDGDHFPDFYSIVWYLKIKIKMDV